MKYVIDYIKFTNYIDELLEIYNKNNDWEKIYLLWDVKQLVHDLGKIYI